MSFLEKRLPKFPMNTTTDMPPFYPWWNEFSNIKIVEIK